MDKWTHSGVTFNATTVGGIIAQNVRHNKTTSGRRTSGEPYVRYRSFTREDPGASFTTLCVQDALDQSGALGLDISDLAAGLIFYAHKHESGSTRAGAGSHRKYVMAKGMIWPTTLRAVIGDDATLDYESVGVSTDSNNPLLHTDGINLPSVTDNERFALGPATIESIALTDIQSIEIAFGLDVRVEYSQAYIHPVYASIQAVTPVITFTGKNIEWLKSDTIPKEGKIITHASTAIYLRKRAIGSSFVANGTEEHIKLTAAGLAYVEPAMDSSGEDAECTVRLECDYDGTNAPIVIDTTSAIT